jgi:hypothetical protein
LFRSIDSVENAKVEMNFFFPEFDVDKWYADEEKNFTCENLKFNPEKLEHEVLKKK